MVDGDAKRLAVILGGMEPALARAVVAYLRFHKPEKTVLRLGKAAKLAEEIHALATAPEVRRGGVGRPNRVAYWVAAIEQMQDARAKLRLPMSGHGYLTEVAFSVADSADAQAERQAEQEKRVGKHLDMPSGATAAPRRESKLQNALAYITQQLHIGAIDADQAAQARAAAREKHGDDRPA